MSASRPTPSRPHPDIRLELAREIARRHSARRRAPAFAAVAAVAAVAVGITVAAATDAAAATVHPTRGSMAAAYPGGHGHALPAADLDPSAVPDPVAGLSGVGAAAPALPDQLGAAFGRDRNAQPGENRERGRDDRRGDGRGRTGQGRDDPRNNDPRNNDLRNNDPRNNNGNGPDRSNTNGLDVLARDCRDSRLSRHTGFQVAPACVDTAFGEVAAADKGPSLLITDAPNETRVGQSFTLRVSTRNLVRDRFLGAAAGGYYLESSVLNAAGLQRGHFHTACRMLDSTSEAPESGPSPAFFVATQDNGGGAQPDEVSITVPGLPERGTAQCTSWAGDGSHRIPMMQRADQTPAIDSVRITVR